VLKLDEKYLQKIIVLSPLSTRLHGF